MYFPSGMGPTIIENSAQSIAQSVNSSLPVVPFHQLGNPVSDAFASLPLWCKLGLGFGVLGGGFLIYKRMR